MANMGDLVTKLIADSTQYTAGTKSAISSNTELHGSVNSIIGQLMRQKKAYEDVGKSTLDWIAADQKASNETKEHARNLLSEVDALKKAAIATRELADAQTRRAAAIPTSTVVTDPMRGTFRIDDPYGTKAKAEADRIARHAAGMPTSTVVGTGTGGKSDFQIQRERDANDPVLGGMARWQKENDAWQRGMNQMRANHEKEMAERKRQSDELRKQQEKDANDPVLKGFAKQKELDDPFQKGLRNMAADKDQEEADRQYRINAARKRDAFEAEDTAEKENQNRIRQRQNDNRTLRRQEQEEENRRLADVRENSRRMAQYRRDDINVQKQISEARKAAIDTQNKSGRLNFAGIEFGRAIEDFTQGSVYGGLKGGILAASNNISQVFIGLQSQMQGSTSRLGQALGNYGGIIGSAISTTMILGVTLYEVLNKAAARTDSAAQGVKRFSEQIEEAVKRLKELRGAERDLININREESPQALKGKLRTTEEQGLELEHEIADRTRLMRDKLVALGAAGPGGKVDAMGLQLAAENAKGVLGNQDVFAAVGLGGEPVKVNQSALTPEFIAQLRKEEEQLFLLQQKRVSLAEQEKAIRQNIPLLEQQQNLIATKFAQNQRQADFAAMQERGKVAMQSRAEDLKLSEMDQKTTWGSAAYRAQKEHEESLRRSAEAERLGIMTPKERQAMDRSSEAKRDRDIRQAKYGDLQADGASGFQSADIKTSAGFNAAIKAMRYGEQDKTIGELKRNGDIGLEIKEAVIAVGEILSMAPVPVVDF